MRLAARAASQHTAAISAKAAADRPLPYLRELRAACAPPVPTVAFGSSSQQLRQRFHILNLRKLGRENNINHNRIRCNFLKIMFKISHGMQ